MLDLNHSARLFNMNQKNDQFIWNSVNTDVKKKKEENFLRAVKSGRFFCPTTLNTILHVITILKGMHANQIHKKRLIRH